MIESCFQRLFGVIGHVEFTFPQNGGGTVCNLRFLLCRLLVVGPVLISLALVFTMPTTCSRPSTKMSAFSFWFFLPFSVFSLQARPFEIKNCNCPKRVLC